MFSKNNYINIEKYLINKDNSKEFYKYLKYLKNRLKLKQTFHSLIVIFQLFN